MQSVTPLSRSQIMPTLVMVLFAVYEPWDIRLPVPLLRDRMIVRDLASNAKFQLTLRQIRRNLCQVR